MFYLIYGYDGDLELDQSCKKEIVESMNVDDSVLQEMSFVYRKEVDWKMFLPPLPVHAGIRLIHKGCLNLTDSSFPFT